MENGGGYESSNGGGRLWSHWNGGVRDIAWARDGELGDTYEDEDGFHDVGSTSIGLPSLGS